MVETSFRTYGEGTYGEGTYGGIELDLAKIIRLKPWTFWLGDSRDMSILGHLRQARARSLSIDNNKTGSVSLTVPMVAQASKLIRPWRTCVIAQRGVGDEAEWHWSGPVSSMQRDYAAGTVTLSAVGWFELLLHRILQDRITFDDADAAQILEDLLGYANAQYPTYITLGEVQPTQLRDRTYEKDANIGQEIQTLGEIESGYDWYVDPTTRELNVVARRGVDRPNCKWLFIADQQTRVDEGGMATSGTSKGNCRNVVEDFDGMTMVNDMYARGKFATGHVSSFESVDRYGVLFQEAASLTDVPDTEILLAYAGGEIIYRQDPKVTYTISPKPHTVPGVPLLFEDYDIGDTTYLTARRDGFEISEQAVRIFGVNLSVDEMGVETVNSIQTQDS